MLTINGKTLQTAENRPGKHRTSDGQREGHLHYPMRNTINSFGLLSTISDEDKIALAYEDETTESHARAVAAVERVKTELRAAKDRRCGYIRPQESNDD